MNKNRMQTLNEWQKVERSTNSWITLEACNKNSQHTVPSSQINRKFWSRCKKKHLEVIPMFQFFKSILLRIISVSVRMNRKQRTLVKTKFQSSLQQLGTGNFLQLSSHRTHLTTQKILCCHTVLPDMQKVIDSIPSTSQEVHVFGGDHATSQFKNKHVMNAIRDIEEVMKKKIYEHFFAAMHWKGVLDGVGAAVKPVATNQVKSGRFVIKSPVDFTSVVQSDNVKIHFMSETEKITAENLWNPTKILDQSRTFQGTFLWKRRWNRGN